MTWPVLATLMAVWMSCQPQYAKSAPCCAPKQWDAEVRIVTMDTTSVSPDGVQEWYWVSYDLDRQQVAIITFDPRPGHGDVYQRELLDYRKGKRYVTPDEFNCTSYPLTGKMERLCVPPTGGNITLDIRMFFGVYPEPDQHHVIHDSPRILPNAASDYSRRLPNIPGRNRRSNPDIGDDSMGMYAETIYYETNDSIGYVTVTAPTCNFVNEMTYATLDDGSLVWRHTQWNNQTQTVDPESFQMPKTCGPTASPGQTHKDTLNKRPFLGLLAHILYNS